MCGMSIGRSVALVMLLLGITHEAMQSRGERACSCNPTRRISDFRYGSPHTFSKMLEFREFGRDERAIYVGMWAPAMMFP